MSEGIASRDGPTKDHGNRAMEAVIVCVFFLMTAGWFMLLDSGLIFEGRPDPVHFHNLVEKRLLCTVVGAALLGIIWLWRPDKLRKLTPIVVLLALVLLVLVWTPLGVAERGSRRWIQLGPFTFQPLEFAKLALVWLMADRIAALGRLGKVDPRRMLLPLVTVVLLVGLVGAQPNLSGAVFLVVLTFAMACIGGMSRRLVFVLTIGAAAMFAALLARHPDRLDRFLPMIRPLTDLSDTGYQVGMSLWAVTGGGLFGRGPGGSIAMYSLPDHTTDFTFSIICEEWGFVGGAIIILLFAALVYAGFRIALAQRDPFRMMLGCGIAAIIGLQSAINMGVTLALLPTTGIPLPFLSAAGSNLILSLGQIGLLLNLGRTVRRPAAARVQENTNKTAEPAQRKPGAYRGYAAGRSYKPNGISTTEGRRRMAR